MKKFALLAGFAALLCTSARAQAQCVGDCNGDNTVAINELITGVNIALGAAEVSTCASFDTSGDGTVTINELITGVNNALGVCEPIGALCGDGNQDEGEECDDGNNFGGDDCAANCTTETARVGVFDGDKTIATVQTQAFPITLKITGRQTFRTGKKRDVAVETKTGPAFGPGEIPVVIKADELLFDAVKVTGLVCACVRGVPVPSFGPGIAGTGSIGCGDAGLTDINYRLIQDHNTTPGDSNNFSQGTPDDPECNDVTNLPGGQTSEACKEGTMAPCNLPSFVHTDPAICNGPRTVSLFGGMAPKGSALILNNTSISLLQDAGACSTAGPRPNGTCPFPDYGPDCLPCTDDDAVIQEPNTLPTTTGTSEAAIFDANDSDAIIDKDQSCLGQPCKTMFNGSPFDCAAIENDPTGGLSGGSLSVTFPSLDANQIGDNVTSTVFFNK